MITQDAPHLTWRKSTWSGDNHGSCVEVAFVGDTHVALRDSKDVGRGPILSFATGEWRAFIAGTVTGEFR